MLEAHAGVACSRRRPRVPIKRLKIALVLLALVAGVASAQILNSERIEQTFGSYGINVAFSDESLRISNLFSWHEGRTITRTLAIVAYPQVVDAAFASVHEQILAGGSIGATFQAAGWQVGKRNLDIREIPLPQAFAAPMEVDAPETPLATHIYQLDIAKDGQSFHYATIVELHHPDYLTTAELAEIYPLEKEPAPEEVWAGLTVLTLGLAQIERLQPER